MSKTVEATNAKEMMALAMECMGVAVTTIDANGSSLYYKPYAAEILDREPEYIGKDVHSHHQKSASNEKLDGMIEEFQAGRKETFRYEAKPYGEPLQVTLSPIKKGGAGGMCPNRLAQSPVLNRAIKQGAFGQRADDKFPWNDTDMAKDSGGFS